MKTLIVVMPLLLTLPLACGGTVESDSSKNAGVLGATADPKDEVVEDDGEDEVVEDDGEDEVVEDDGEDEVVEDEDAEDDQSDDLDDTDDGSSAQEYEAVALTRAQLDALRESEATDLATSVSTTGGGNTDLDPEDLFLRVSDLGSVCTESYTPLTCGGHWSLSIALPPAYQTVGVYDLTDPLISQYSMMSETGELNSTNPDDCGWGGGTIPSGTIELLAIDANEVRFRVTLKDSLWKANSSGEYTATRCQ